MILDHDFDVVFEDSAAPTRHDGEGLGVSQGPQNRLEIQVQKRDDTHIGG